MLRHNFLVWKLTPDPWPRWPHSAHPPHLKLMLLFSSSKLLLHHRHHHHRRTFLWIVPSRIDLLRYLSKIAWTWSASANKPHAAVLPKPKYEEQRPARAAPRCWALTNRHLDGFIELYPVITAPPCPHCPLHWTRLWRRLHQLRGEAKLQRYLELSALVQSYTSNRGQYDSLK